jgi:hypothetical protein
MRSLNSRVQTAALVISIFCFLLIGLTAFLIVRKTIIAPLKSIPAAIQSFSSEQAHGQQSDAEILNREDEIGDVLRAVNAFGDDINKKREIEEARRHSEEEVRRQIEAERQANEAAAKRKADEDAAQQRAREEKAERRRLEREKFEADERLEVQKSVVDTLGAGLAALAAARLNEPIQQNMHEDYEALRLSYS